MNARSSWQKGPTSGVHRWDFERLDQGEQQDREMLAKMRTIRRAHKSDALPPMAEQVRDGKGVWVWLATVVFAFAGGMAFQWMLQLSEAVLG